MIKAIALELWIASFSVIIGGLIGFALAGGFAP